MITVKNPATFLSINENNLWNPRLRKKWFILTQRMGSAMIIVHKISNNVSVHVDCGKDVISKVIVNDLCICVKGVMKVSLHLVALPWLWHIFQCKNAGSSY